MESLREQVEYGNYCIHGTNIGTPGGADLMCGACEDGYTVLHQCPACGQRMWRKYGQRVRHESNASARSKRASEIVRFRRDPKIANKMLAHIVREGWQPVPKFVHTYNGE